MEFTDAINHLLPRSLSDRLYRISRRCEIASNVAPLVAAIGRVERTVLTHNCSLLRGITCASRWPHLCKRGSLDQNHHHRLLPGREAANVQFRRLLSGSSSPSSQPPIEVGWPWWAPFGVKTSSWRIENSSAGPPPTH